jgi:hypothetical protein
MKRKRTASVVAVVLTASLFAAAGCGSDPEKPFTTFSVTVERANTESQAIHILAPGEDFPAGRVNANSLISSTMQLEEDASVTFRAGRNGAVLQTISCKVVGDEEDNYQIEWNGGSAGLQCDGDGWQ